MSNLPEAERDALDVVRALAGLAALTQDGADDGADPERTRRLLLRLAENGGVSAARVLAYLRALRGPGDGEAAVVPPRLGPWRDWAPARAYPLAPPRPRTGCGEVPRPRRADPGE